MKVCKEIREINEEVKRLAEELDQIQRDFEGMSDEKIPKHLNKAKIARRKLDKARRDRARLW